MWKPGSVHKVDPEKAYKEIERIRKRNKGEVSPQSVVEAAKVQKNPLHKEFEWDNKKAANKFRLEQARGLLRHLVVIREETASGRPTRLYEVDISDQEDPPQPNSYFSLEEMLSTPDGRMTVLCRAKKELIAFRNRYADLEELAGVFGAIDNLNDNAA